MNEKNYIKYVQNYFYSSNVCYKTRAYFVLESGVYYFFNIIVRKKYEYKLDTYIKYEAYMHYKRVVVYFDNNDFLLYGKNKIKMCVK